MQRFAVLFLLFNLIPPFISISAAQTFIRIPMVTDELNPKEIRALIPAIPATFSFSRETDGADFLSLTEEINSQFESLALPFNVQRFSSSLAHYPGACFQGRAAEAVEILNLLSDSVLTAQFVVLESSLVLDSVTGLESIHYLWDSSDEGDNPNQADLKPCTFSP
jgi:hypothetical protein